MASGWFLAAAGVVLSGSAALAQPDAGNEYARQKLVAEHVALTPGKTNYLGVTFDISPGWHLYWKGTNDTGFPIRIDLDLPPGYSLGEIQWPAPKRYIVPGDMLDHIYERRVTLLLPVEVPAGASGEVRIKGTTEFLVCQEACLPGGGDLDLKIAAGGPGAGQKSGQARLFDEARERIPKPLPKENPPVSWRLDGAVMEITSPKAKEMMFYPAEDCVALEAPIADAATRDGKLRLRLADMSLGPRVKGVLEIKPAEAGAKAQIYTIDFPIAEAAPVLVAPPR